MWGVSVVGSDSAVLFGLAFGDALLTCVDGPCDGAGSTSSWDGRLRRRRRRRRSLDDSAVACLGCCC